MWSMLFQTIVAPTLVGVVLALFTYWLDKRDDD
ncbi:type I toxin-antitoxin system Fst family toxin [Streptococcus ovis]|nr:type I toxin-antitoxin system Fst family toxin [Streptococcus ovis]